MSGCYRCGLSDGSDERLCETCFTQRFHCGKLALEPYSTTPATGIEMSPRIQRWILSGSAVLYLGVLSIGMAVQGERLAMRQMSVESEYLRMGGNEYPVSYQREFGFIAGPRAASIKD